MTVSQLKTISREELLRVAALAGMCIPDDEVEILADQLNTILVHVNRLASLDTEQTEPLIFPFESSCTTREDIPGPTLEQSQVTDQAPLSDGEHIIVPGVICLE